jgi:hypothetical protein
MNDEYRLYGILKSKLESVWDDAIPFIKQALEYSNDSCTVSDIYKALNNSDMQLWCIFNNEGMQGICVTEMKVYPQYKCLYAVLGAGIEFYKWAHLWSIIHDFAHSNGCSRERIKGRKGWERNKEMKAFGFEYAYTVLEFKFDNTHH